MSSIVESIKNLDIKSDTPEKTRKDLQFDKSEFRYPNYAPTFNPEQKYPPYEQFEFKDPGLLADENLANLFPNGLPSTDADKRAPANTQIVKFGYSHIELTPKFGSEIRGVQLSQLSDEAKNDLARFVAERGVVVFRDQDLRDLPIEQALKFAEHFGRQHIHPTSGSPEGHPEVHLVYRDSKRKVFDEYFAKKISSTAFHSDVTYEQQPPGTTFLGILDSPSTGGDTVFADTVEIYNRLSPEFKKRLHGLKAIHSAHEQAEFSRVRGGVVRREPVKTAHPIVRTHPVTKKKAIFVNNQFTRYVEGFKSEESDYLLNFLYDVIAKSADTQVRAKWEDGTVVVWDNRRAVHSALLDWDAEGQTRHAFRLTPQAEVPYETPFE
ncbi:Jlp1p [Sugiyamaella lignohabitans]|uniref:Jlp1p n=1 Tax=Sugiyamaella lignohabitans TaxID=796027 RepID=A0A167F5C4_9ASCO|nr:Jlp1p [Sugiyamaella lignohabitans]ANB14845.1 Jlp1p [Sugiyamaella lignohabitans]